MKLNKEEKKFIRNNSSMNSRKLAKKLGKSKKDIENYINSPKLLKKVLIAGFLVVLPTLGYFTFFNNNTTKTIENTYLKTPNLIEKINKITFMQAKQNKSLRNNFVKQIEKLCTSKFEYIGNIKYNNNFNYNIRGEGMEITNFKAGDIGSHKKYNIVIHDNAFDSSPIKTKNDFFSVLIDHEIEGHAKNFYYGFDNFKENDLISNKEKQTYDLNTSKDVFELVAYGNQLRKSKVRQISQNHLIHTLLQYYKYYSDLIHPIRDNSILDKNKLEEFREDFFIEDFLNMNATLRGYNTPVILENCKFMTQFGVPVKLSKNICSKYDL